MITTIRLHNAIYIKHKKVIFVYIPKVACTNWKAVLRFVNDNAENYLDSKIAHNRESSGLSFLSEEKNANSILINKDIKKYTVVRNPYTRVLSAFLNKFSVQVCQNEKYFDNIKNEILLYKKTSKIDTDNENVTFYSFLHWLKHSNSNFIYDEHWRLQTRIIGDDLSLYDYVGRFENLEKDTQIILDAIGFNKSFPSQNDVNFQPTKAQNKVNHFYGQKEKELAYSIYKKDFEILGYSNDLETSSC